MSNEKPSTNKDLPYVKSKKSPEMEYIEDEIRNLTTKGLFFTDTHAHLTSHFVKSKQDMITFLINNVTDLTKKK